MATITKKLGFENLLQYASLGKDSDGDGVVDGWRAFGSASATTSWLFDEEEKAQMINIVDTADRSDVAIESEQYIPVTEGLEYTFSAYMRMKGELPPESGGKLIIMWYDEASPLGLMGSNESGVFVDADYTRHSLTATAPTGALFAKVRIEFHASIEQISGTLWTKWAQFQEGNTATDYEETDFFTIESPAEDDSGDGHTYGWSITTSGSNRRLSSDEVSDLNSNGAYLKFSTPINAGTVTVQMDVDTTELTGTNDSFDLWFGDKLASVTAGLTQTISVEVPRGPVGLVLRHFRDSDTVFTNQIHVDNIVVSWDELTSPPPAPTPPTAQKVFILDFESDEYDPFFTVKNTADGYSYGFERVYTDRNSGWYSFGVKETDVPGDIDEDSPPRIPGDETAGGSVSFDVPITAIDPNLRFFIKFDGEEGGETGRALLNGEEIWFSQTNNGWEEITVALTPGVHYDLVFEYTKNSFFTEGADTIYVDDIIVSYDIPDKPVIYAATAPTTEIKTTSTSFSVQETFENSTINKFFTVQNPSKLKSGGGPSEYPETGWTRTILEAYQGSYGFRAIYPGNGEDSAVDFTFKVPHGVKNAKVEWWNFVELERSANIPSGAKYNRLYEEYRIWVNYSLWKDFHYCSPSLTNSVHYTGPESRGDPGNDYACPWGRWWKETLNLTPGRTYTLTFELQRDSGDSSDIHGRNLCVIDNLTVSWTETPGDVITVPPQPLIYFDGRDGFFHLYDRNGAEMAPLSFAEYKVFGVPGSIHQFTQVDPRMIDFSLLITGKNRDEIRQKMRELTTKLSNRPLTLIVVYPEGEERQINCRLADILGRERMGEQGPGWKKVVLSFRAFDPFWYGEKIVVDGAGPENAGYFPTEVMVKNPGDAETWPIFKLYGPITNPQVQLVDPNNDLNIYAEFKLTGFTIPPGRYVVVDTRPGRKTIILDDGQNLYQYLDPSINQLFSIPPGEYVVDLDGSSADSNTKIVVEFQPPYWGV